VADLNESAHTTASILQFAPEKANGLLLGEKLSAACTALEEPALAPNFSCGYTLHQGKVCLTLKFDGLGFRRGMDSMRVVILDEELPFPPTSGKRIRTYNLVKRLAQRHSITYVCHQNADVEEARRAADHFAAIGIEPIVVPRSIPPKKGWAFGARLAVNLFSPLPYSVASHRSEAIVRVVRQLARSRTIDLWHCEWTPYAESMKTLADVRWVVVAHNVESMIWRRLADHETNFLKRQYIEHQWRKYVRFERWAYAAATRCIAVSEDDARQLCMAFGAGAVNVVDNGVDTAYFRPLGSPRDSKTILFMGSLDWRANQDAVRVLVEQIFPEILRAEPRARLQIVGRHPPPWLQRLNERPGIVLHANVADVRPYLAHAGVLAVPLRIGGGSRLKILEALASETPVVSTRIGAEGLKLTPGEHLEVVDGVNQMVPALLRAIHHPELLRRQAVAGRQVVLEQYDWQPLAEKLEMAWNSALYERVKVQAA
jgi:glycosyltransferase involved in cell wall biosynthesis